MRNELIGELEQAENNIRHHQEELAVSKRIARGCRAALEAMDVDELKKQVDEARSEVLR